MPLPSFSRLVSTIAPTIATNSKMDVISNGKRNWLNNVIAISNAQTSIEFGGVERSDDSR